jgi:predicted 2-oxoglutarate/Fe(II)-dependent dioxygenase YbiX
VSVPAYQQEAIGVFATRLYGPKECASIVAEVKNQAEWEAAQVVVESDGRARDLTLPDTRAARILNRSQAAAIYDEFEQKVDRLVQPLVRQIWEVDLPRQEGTQLVRYLPGGHYVAHQDANQAELANRYFTVLCYLNDSFEGGKTNFTSLNLSAAPDPGKTLVFPARYMHCAEPVMRGEKFVFITWLCGPVPIRWI